ncbi:hypothetical protein H6G97_50180 [Nostoc flagelliforme FACHB-838]|uniref:Uncharacterized protein n=1 Tax=Nostoc flagelliforme FACHB-838 TaxID=2692904 RepID=A0ABR8E611_9NOSO|nr:hypothetical protein [Nostoc flagelliforme FACHB-838]
MRTADVPQKVKDRPEVIRLRAHGCYVDKIAAQIKESLTFSKVISYINVGEIQDEM